MSFKFSTYSFLHCSNNILKINFQVMPTKILQPDFEIFYTFLYLKTQANYPVIEMGPALKYNTNICLTITAWHNTKQIEILYFALHLHFSLFQWLVQFQEVIVWHFGMCTSKYRAWNISSDGKFKLHFKDWQTQIVWLSSEISTCPEEVLVNLPVYSPWAGQRTDCYHLW